MKRLIVASHNKGKIKEYDFMLHHLIDMGVNIDPSNFDLVLASDIDPSIVFPEEKGKTYEENAIIKADSAYRNLINKKLLNDGDIVFGDDTGLEVFSMPNELGLYTARFLGEDTLQSERNKEVVRRLNEGNKDRSARFICVIAYIENGNISVAKGIIEGFIAKEVDEGSNGFGYDPIFVASVYDKPFSRCSTLEKIKVCHRGKAFSKMLKNIGDNKC